MDVKVIVAAHTTGNSTAVNLSRGQSPSVDPFEAVDGEQAIAMLIPSATCDRIVKLQGSVDSGFSSPVDLVAMGAVGRSVVAKVAMYPYMRASTTTAGTAGDVNVFLLKH